MLISDGREDSLATGYNLVWHLRCFQVIGTKITLNRITWKIQVSNVMTKDNGKKIFYRDELYSDFISDTVRLLVDAL